VKKKKTKKKKKLTALSRCFPRSSPRRSWEFLAATKIELALTAAVMTRQKATRDDALPFSTMSSTSASISSIVFISCVFLGLANP